MAFNADQFASAAVDPLPTQYEVVPEGEFPFIIDSDPKQLTPRHIKWNDKDTGEAREFYQLELNCLCQDDKIKAKLGRDRVPVRLRINLDLNENGGLAVGANKNVMLGQLRAALNQNTPGWTPAALLGAGPFIGKVAHSSDKKDATKKYADISRVAKVA